MGLCGLVSWGLGVLVARKAREGEERGRLIPLGLGIWQPGRRIITCTISAHLCPERPRGRRGRAVREAGRRDSPGKRWLGREGSARGRGPVTRALYIYFHNIHGSERVRKPLGVRQ